MSTDSRWSRPKTGTDDWRPSLLRVPGALKRAAEEWLPVLVRERHITTLGVLGIFLALQFLIPARLVISGMGAAGRPSVAVGLLLAFLWLLSVVRARELPGGRQPVRWLVGLFVASQLVGYVIGFDRGPSDVEASSADRWLIFVIAMAGVSLAVADGIRTRADLDRLLRLTVGLSSLMALVGVLQFFRLVDLARVIQLPGLQLNNNLIVVGTRGDTLLARVAGTASHYIEFGVVLALVLPIALHYAFFAPPGRTRAWRWAQAGVVAFAIPLSISRSAILTVVVTFLMLAIVWPWRHRYNAIMVSLVCLALFRVINPGVLGTLRSLFANAENDPSVLDRIARTERVMDLWALRPVLGRGAGMVIPEQYFLLDNQLFGTLLAGGVVGLAVLLLFFLAPYGMARSIRLRGADQETRHLGQALAVTMPAALLASATFDSLSFPTFVGLMFLIVGAIGALWRLDGATFDRPLQMGDPTDKYVAAPLTGHARERIARAWGETRQGARDADGARPARQDDGVPGPRARSGEEATTG